MAIFRRRSQEEIDNQRNLENIRKILEEDYDNEKTFDVNGDGVVDEHDLVSGDDFDKNSELVKAQQLIQESPSIIEDLPKPEHDNPETYITSIIEMNKCSTIGIKMEGTDLLFSCVYPTGPTLKRYNNYGGENYNKLCERLFQIDLNEKFNCSRSVRIKNVKARIYANMPPLVEFPIVTISTTKEPPANLNLEVSDEILNKIVHSNFIVCGASGSGKTYLTNYLLSKFISENERIAFVEEFSELNPPNDFTICITTPPAKPDTKPLLKFVTEQTNLMRLDAVYVGEVKGAEAFPMVVNMASGTRGGCTIHGESPRQALSRLKTLCQLGAEGISERAVDEFIAKSINYVIQMKKHKITYIGQLKGTSTNGNFSMDTIYGGED